jgi:hypothetical protein
MTQRLRFPFKTHKINPDDTPQVNACHKAILHSRTTTNPVVVLWDDTYKSYHVRETYAETKKWKIPEWVWQAEFSNGFVAAYRHGKVVTAVGYPETGYGGRLVLK